MEINGAGGSARRGENARDPLFFVAHSEKPAMIHNVKRESGGESDPYEGRPIQKRETKTQTHSLYEART